MEFHLSNIVGNKKKLHQARISGDLKEHIRVLAVIEGKSISDVTEEALVNYIDENKSRLRQYHLNMSKSILGGVE